MYCIFFIESEEYQKNYVDSFAVQVAAKRKPSVPGEASRPQKRTPVSAQLVDGRRLEKGCSLCKGTAGIPGDKHSRTTCTKLLIHGVNSSLKLDELLSLGTRSVTYVRQCLEFSQTTLEENIPPEWVHVVIQDFFAAPLGSSSDLVLVFKVAGLNHIGDLITGKDFYVSINTLVRKYERCMTSYQAKRMMILSYKAGRFATVQTSETECETTITHSEIHDTIDI